MDEHAINFGFPFSMNEQAQVTDPKNKKPLKSGEEIWVYGNDQSCMSPHFISLINKIKTN